MNSVKELVKNIIDLNVIERHILISTLFESGKFDFISFVRYYVEDLNQKNASKNHSISALGLMLGMYCMTDTSDAGKTARKHLYESGMYGNEDGTKFGQMLDEEFKNRKADNREYLLKGM